MRLLLPLFLVLAGCRTTAPPLDPAEPTLVGTWVWVESSGGKMGSVLTPKSEGYTLRFLAGDNGRFAFTREGRTWTAGRFETAPDRIAYHIDVSPETTSVINWSGLGQPPAHRFSFDAAGMLVLDEGCCDRFKHVFRRLP